MGPFVNHDNTKHRPGGAYSKVIQDIQTDGVCPFCPEHLARYHKNPILFENDHWLVTDNMYPYQNAAHHLLLIHKKHIQSVSELTAAAWIELKQAIDKAVELKKIQGAALMMRFGNTAFTGASVTHLHAQITAGTGEPDAEPILTRVG